MRILFEGGDHKIIYIDDEAQMKLYWSCKLACHKWKNSVFFVIKGGWSKRNTNRFVGIKSAVDCNFRRRWPNIPHDLQLEEAPSLRPKSCTGGVRKDRKDSILKFHISQSKARSWLLKDSHSDSGCGIKIIDREVF